MSLAKLLFASTHCLLDPSSGAALATRDILGLPWATPYRLAEAQRGDGFTVPVFDLEAGAACRRGVRWPRGCR